MKNWLPWHSSPTSIPHGHIGMQSYFRPNLLAKPIASLCIINEQSEITHKEHFWTHDDIKTSLLTHMRGQRSIFQFTFVLVSVELNEDFNFQLWNIFFMLRATHENSLLQNPEQYVDSALFYVGWRESFELSCKHHNVEGFKTAKIWKKNWPSFRFPSHGANSFLKKIWPFTRFTRRDFRAKKRSKWNNHFEGKQ